MAENKTNLDCIELKRQLQEKVLKEREGLKPEDLSKNDQQHILSDANLGALWRRLSESHKRRAG